MRASLRGRPAGGKCKRKKHFSGPPPREALSEKEGKEDYSPEEEKEKMDAVTSGVASMNTSD